MLFTLKKKIINNSPSWVFFFVYFNFRAPMRCDAERVNLRSLAEPGTAGRAVFALAYPTKGSFTHV